MWVVTCNVLANVLFGIYLIPVDYLKAAGFLWLSEISKFVLITNNHIEFIFITMYHKRVHLSYQLSLYFELPLFKYFYWKVQLLKKSFVPIVFICSHIAIFIKLYYSYL